MRQTLELTCEKCDRVWKAPVVIEYGITNYVNNSDAVCPDCGMEADTAEILDHRKAFEEYRYESWKERRSA